MQEVAAVTNSAVDIATFVEVAVAPVFLLAGLGGILAVISSRLARIIDYSRVLEATWVSDPEGYSRLVKELDLQRVRAKLVTYSIALCTLTALQVAAIILILFMGVFFTFDPSEEVAMLFISGMLCFVGGLLLFLQEVFLSTRILRFGLDPNVMGPHLPGQKKKN